MSQSDCVVSLKVPKFDQLLGHDLGHDKGHDRVTIRDTKICIVSFVVPLKTKDTIFLKNASLIFFQGHN